LFDLVILSHVLEHMPDDRQLLHEAVRTLNPGGHLAILVPLEEEVDRKQNSDHIRSYSRAPLLALIEQLGFDPVVTQQDHRIENLLRWIEASRVLGRSPKLKSRILGGFSLLLATMRGSERFPYPGPPRNLGILARLRKY
jgi:2-polyprenyl-3-methyl-5-hydroxy-6-metoxy-1,4-benzoquinol methylase